MREWKQSASRSNGSEATSDRGVCRVQIPRRQCVFEFHAHVCVAVAIWIIAHATALAVGSAKPVWIVSNGFHTSFGFRTRDLPFARRITGDPQPPFVLIGWGATDFYEGKTNPWTLVEALFGSGGSILHVVPVRGAISDRFSHSDVVELKLSAEKFRRLTDALDQSFARDSSGRFKFIVHGYYTDSRFYAGVERFYFPKMCNVWVAEKLHRSGVSICVPNSLIAFELMWQAKKLGKREQRLGRPRDVF